MIPPEATHTQPDTPKGQPATHPRRSALIWFWLGMITGVAVTLVLTAKSTPGVTASQEATPDRAEARPLPTAINFTLRDANRQGNKNAPVTIVEFSDFQCAYCWQFYRLVEPELYKQYIATGKVTFVYKHLPASGQESTWAAEAAECAADQGKFWAYHDWLFEHLTGENDGAFTKDNLLKFARQLNLDLSQFEPCLTNDQTLDRVQADQRESEQAGVRGTPTFYVNGQPLVGAQPFEAFQAVIESKIKGK
jgi:protein-disulfide isomerase